MGLFAEGTLGQEQTAEGSTDSALSKHEMNSRNSHCGFGELKVLESLKG